MANPITFPDGVTWTPKASGGGVSVDAMDADGNKVEGRYFQAWGDYQFACMDKYKETKK